MDFFKKKLKHLIVPYLFWSLLLYAGGWVIHEIIGGQLSGFLTNLGFQKLTWAQILVNIILFEDYYVEHLWFIYVLFMFFAVNLLTGRKLNKVWVAFMIISVGGIMNRYLGLPHLVWKFFKHYSDFLMGRIACAVITEKGEGTKISAFPKTAFIASVITLAAFIAQLIFENAPGLWNAVFNPISQHVFWWGFGICCYLFARRVANKKIAQGMVLIGNYSYDIYLMHTPYVVPVVAMISYRMTGLWAASFLMTVICGIAVPLLASKFIVRKISILNRIALGNG